MFKYHISNFHVFAFKNETENMAETFKFLNIIFLIPYQQASDKTSFWKMFENNDNYKKNLAILELWYKH